ncbi:MAG: hypothetical protein HKN33_06200 [Pyrinomonadaceae bacterium]|nr:hypothetical protein [Pyrinomonadaceae bacterium]
MNSTSRTVVPLHNDFFNDGHWYVLSSSSLGGGGLGIPEFSEKLQSEDVSVINELLRKGICLPLYFGCDCALDNAIFVVGDLNEREEAEWIGRIRLNLEVPCGELMLMGGGLEEDFETALPNFEPPDPHFRFFQKLKLEPGSYLVEVYAFLGSYPVNEEWEELENENEMDEWWEASRPGEAKPEWISFFNDDEYVDSEEFEFIEHIIRVVPSSGEVPLPGLDEETKWVGEFEMRRPELCPKGLKREDVL